MEYIKTKWVNGETPINESNLNNIEDGIEALQRNRITAYLSSNLAFPAGTESYKIIDLDSATITGDKLALGEATTSSGTVKGILIPSGVKKINIGCYVSIVNNNNTSAMYFVVYVQRVRNGETSIVSRLSSTDIPAGGRISSAAIPPFDLEVQEGDLYYLRMYKSIASGICEIVGSASEKRTFITAEAIEVTPTEITDESAI